MRIWPIIPVTAKAKIPMQKKRLASAIVRLKTRRAAPASSHMNTPIAMPVIRIDITNPPTLGGRFAPKPTTITYAHVPTSQQSAER